MRLSHLIFTCSISLFSSSSLINFHGMVKNYYHYHYYYLYDRSLFNMCFPHMLELGRFYGRLSAFYL